MASPELERQLALMLQCQEDHAICTVGMEQHVRLDDQFAQFWNALGDDQGGGACVWSPHGGEAFTR